MSGQAVDQDVQTEETNLDEAQGKEPETESEENPEIETESKEADDQPADEPKAETEATDDAEDGDEASDEEEGGIDVQIGEAAPASADDEPKGVELTRALRKQNRELAKEVRRLKAAGQPAPQQTEQRPFVGPEPTPDDEDVNWDPKKLVEKTAKHLEDKRKAAEFDARQKAKNEEADKRVKEQQADYFKKRDALAKMAPDVEEAEEYVVSTFTPEQQSLIVSACNDAPRVALALKRNPQEAKRLAAIKDLPKFTAALGVLESKVKVTSRKPGTSPPTPVRGGGGNNSLKALEAQANKTGNFTKLFEAEERAEKARKK